MAKITPYKLARVGATQGKVAPSVATARLTTISVNRLGSAVTGMGGVVDDIRRIQVLRIKDTKLAERLERKRLQRERDQAAEEQTEQNTLMKKGIKSNLKPNNKQKGLLDSILPKWIQLFKPVFEFIASIIAIPVIREMLKWWGDPANKEKIETFFYKANVIFKKLKAFGDWLINDKLLGGWDKFKNGDTFKERLQGLGDLLTGIGIISILTNPLGALGGVLTGLGWLVKNISNWLKDPFAFLKKKPKIKKIDLNKSKSSGKTKSGQNKLRNKYKLWKKSKGLKPIVTNVGGNKYKVRKGWFFDGPDRGKFKSTPGQAPGIPKPGAGVKPQTGWKGLINKAKNFGKKMKVPGWMGKAGKFFGPATTTIFAGLELKDRLVDQDQTPEKAISGTAASVGGGLAGFTLGAKTSAATLSPLLVAPFPGARLIYGAGVIGGGIMGSMAGSNIASSVSDKAFDAHEDKKKETKWYNPFSWSSSNDKTNNITKPKKEEVVKIKKKEEKKNKWSWKNLFGSNKKKEKKQNFVTPKQTFTKKETTKKKPWWKLWMSGGQHKKLPEFFIGKIFKKITKTVSNVVSGVGKAVSGIVNTVGEVVSNPIVSTALSFVPGVGPIIGAINAVQSLSQGDVLGALMQGYGALGNFSAIGSTAKSIVNTPDWMLNLRMSSFGQGLANMHSGISGAISGITSGWNNFMGSDIGKLGKNIFTGLTGGGWGGAIQQGLGMTGLMDDGAFFGAGGTMSNFGSFLSNNNLTGIGNMFPGLGNMISNSPFGGLPGLSELFDGSFSPMSAIGGMAEKAGAGGLFRSVMGMYQGTTDYYTGIKAVAEDIGMGTEAFGVIDKGRDLYNKSKQFALEQPDIEIIPLIAPIILEQPVIAPKVKKQLMRVLG